MFLGINGWPPLASHLVCILFGVSVAHLSWHEAPTPARLPPHTVALGLPPALLLHGGGAAPQRGAQIHLVRTAPGTPGCRLTEPPALLLEKAPTPIVALPLAAARLLPSLMQDAKSGRLAVRPAAAAAGLPLCATRPKVTYGAG